MVTYCSVSLSTPFSQGLMLASARRPHFLSEPVHILTGVQRRRGIWPFVERLLGLDSSSSASWASTHRPHFLSEPVRRAPPGPRPSSSASWASTHRPHFLSEPVHILTGVQRRRGIWPFVEPSWASTHRPHFESERRSIFLGRPAP